MQVAGAGVGYGVQIVLARWLGPTAYGTYVYAIDWALLFATLGSLGLPVAVLRFVPEYRSAQSHGLLRGLLRSSRRLVLLGTTTLSLVGSTILFVLQPAHLNVTALTLGLWLAPILGLMLLETEILRAARRMVLAYGPSRVLRRLLILGGLGALAALPFSASPITVLILAGLASLAVFIIQRRGTYSIFREHLADAPSHQKTRFWLSVSLPLLLSKSFLMIISKTDIFVIGALTNPEQVGFYNAALRTAHAVTFLGFAVDAVAAPAISTRYKEGKAALQQLASRLAHWYFWPTLGLAIGIGLLSGSILDFFGPGFRSHRIEVFILMTGLVINASMGMHLYLLKLTGLERACAFIFGACAFLNILLNVVGVAMLGTMGAALATMTTLIVLSLWTRRTVVVRLGIRPSIVHTLS